jgi:hypothetical protein
MIRQQALSGEAPDDFAAVVDESVLRRVIGRPRSAGVLPLSPLTDHADGRFGGVNTPPEVFGRLVS